jgi:hypothetical protein
MTWLGIGLLVAGVAVVAVAGALALWLDRID